MATLDRDDDFDPETHNRYRCRLFTLADGTATLYLPADWVLEEERFSFAEFVIPWVPGARLFVKVMSYEDTEAITRNDLAHLLGGQGLPPAEPAEYRDEGSVAWERQTVRHTGKAGRPEDPHDAPSEALWLWRRIGLLPPDHIRTIEVRLHIPLQDAKHKRAVETVHFIDRIVPMTIFAAQPTAADRVAPNETLRRDWFWDTICLRVPADWPEAERENPDGTGMFVFDDKPAERWTLWIDRQHLVDRSFSRSANPDWTALRVAQGLAEETRTDEGVQQVEVIPVPGRPAEAVTKVQFESEERGVRLRHISWQKIFFVGPAVIIGQFAWVVPLFAVNDPDIVALTALVEREVLNSLAIDREAFRLRRDPAGRA